MKTGRDHHLPGCDCQNCRRRRSPRPELEDHETGSHPMGPHVWVLIRTGMACQPRNTQPGATAFLLQALAQAMDMVGAGIAAVRPRAASAAVAPVGHRDRGTSGKPDPDRILGTPLPMNPVAGHNASGSSRAPHSRLDSSYWIDQHDRVSDHWDRCEVIRRAAEHLGALLRPSPAAKATADENAKRTKDPTIEQQILDDGHGHDLEEVARHFQMTVRAVAMIRIEAKPARHPLTGKQWAPPVSNDQAADEARAMKAAGLTSTDIGRALGRGAAAVRNWTSERRRAA